MLEGVRQRRSRWRGCGVVDMIIICGVSEGISEVCVYVCVCVWAVRYKNHQTPSVLGHIFTSSFWV